MLKRLQRPYLATCYACQSSNSFSSAAAPAQLKRRCCVQYQLQLHLISIFIGDSTIQRQLQPHGFSCSNLAQLSLSLSHALQLQLFRQHSKAEAHHVITSCTVALSDMLSLSAATSSVSTQRKWPRPSRCSNDTLVLAISISGFSLRVQPLVSATRGVFIQDGFSISL